MARRTRHTYPVTMGTGVARSMPTVIPAATTRSTTPRACPDRTLTDTPMAHILVSSSCPASMPITTAVATATPASPTTARATTGQIAATMDTVTAITAAGIINATGASRHRHCRRYSRALSRQSFSQSRVRQVGPPRRSRTRALDIIRPGAMTIRQGSRGTEITRGCSCGVCYVHPTRIQRGSGGETSRDQRVRSATCWNRQSTIETTMTMPVIATTDFLRSRGGAMRPGGFRLRTLRCTAMKRGMCAMNDGADQ